MASTGHSRTQLLTRNQQRSRHQSHLTVQLGAHQWFLICGEFPLSLVFPFAACPAAGLPDCLCQVQQANRGEQQVPELRERRHAVAVSAGHIVNSDPATPDQIPAVAGAKQLTTELLQTRHSREGDARRRSASADHK